MLIEPTRSLPLLVRAAAAPAPALAEPAQERVTDRVESSCACGSHPTQRPTDTPAQAALAAPTADVPERASHVYLIAPPNYRPSQWVDMLIDYDAVCGLDPNLVDCRYLPQGRVLELDTAMLAPSHPQAGLRQGVFWDLMDKARSNGWTASLDERLSALDPRAMRAIQDFCQANRVPVMFRQD